MFLQIPKQYILGKSLVRWLSVTIKICDKYNKSISSFHKSKKVNLRIFELPTNIRIEK